MLTGSRIHQPAKRSSWPRLDWPLCLMVLLAAAVVLPRSYLIAQAHSEAFDDAYHLKRGVVFLTRSLASSDLELNDPPLGEGIVALPMLVTNIIEGREPADDRLYDVPQRAETLAVQIALWNSVVFVGFLGVVFCWCRRIYGPRSAWFAVTLFVIEPNFAAHIPIAALDVLGVEGIVVAVLLAWRYFEHPSTGRLLRHGARDGVSAHAQAHGRRAASGDRGVRRPSLGDSALAGSRSAGLIWKLALPGRVRSLAILGAIAPLGIWPLSLFDCSPPMNRSAVERQSIGVAGGAVGQGKALRVAIERSLHFDGPWPAGCYLRAFRSGLAHGVTGHVSYLNGQRESTDGGATFRSSRLLRCRSESA